MPLDGIDGKQSQHKFSALIGKKGSFFVFSEESCLRIQLKVERRLDFFELLPKCHFENGTSKKQNDD